MVSSVIVYKIKEKYIQHLPEFLIALFPFYFAEDHVQQEPVKRKTMDLIL